MGRKLIFKKLFDNSFYPYYYDINNDRIMLNECIPNFYYFNNIAMAEKITNAAKETLNKLIEQYGERIVESY